MIECKDEWVNAYENGERVKVVETSLNVSDGSEQIS